MQKKSQNRSCHPDSVSLLSIYGKKAHFYDNLTSLLRLSALKRGPIMDFAMGGAISICVLGYLVYVMIFPEKF
jgi:K+-transporting ATPase KdpF subunit